MIEWHDLLFAGLAFAAEVIGTLSGFGSSTFFVPAAIYLEPITLVLVLTAILHVFGNLSKIYLFRQKLSPFLIASLAVPFFLTSALGAHLTTSVSPQGLKFVLGLALIFLASLRLLHWTHWPPSIAYGMNALSGLMTGLVGTGGALRGMALATLQIDKHTFVFLSAVIDLGGDLLRVFMYLRAGYMDWAQWVYLPLLLTAALAGSWVGSILLRRVPQQHFEKIVTIFVFVSGLSLLAAQWRGH